MTKCEFLVVDSGGFIKNVPIQEIANRVVTLHEVIQEIRDKPTRQRLQVLPYELEFRKASPAGLKVVTEFSKKTGDYASLSSTDLQVLAVTYDLEIERLGGADHLNREPVTQRTVEFYKPTKGIPAGDRKIAGFYEPTEDDVVVEAVVKEDTFSEFQFWREPIPDIPIDFELDVETEEVEPVFTLSELESLDKFLAERSYFCGFEVSVVDFFIFEHLDEKSIAEFVNISRWYRHLQSHPRQQVVPHTLSLNQFKLKIETNLEFSPEDLMDTDVKEVVDGESSDEGVILDDNDSDKENAVDDEVDDDDEGWITPSNLKDKKALLGGRGEEAPVEVACVTTDFAMQNVLKQIGLNMISAEGMLIRETKTWILRCYACFRTTPQLDKKFCPKCGNKTLKRVSVTLNEDGSQQIHISTRRPICTKGKKFSLPAHKGGKHAFNPKLFDDQPEAQQRLSKKAIAKNNPMDADYVVGSSPFLTKDVTSKSAMMGLKGPGLGQAKPSGVYWAKKNPNSTSKNTGNKRKK